MKNKFAIFVMCLLVLCSCKEEQVDYQSNDCKRQPAFIPSIGFDPNRSAFSTSERKIMGLSLLQINFKGDTSNGGRKIYQHPSWKTAGWLGPIQVDPFGNCFVSPVPVISTINNPVTKQNIIYKVDAATGEMKPFVELPVTDSLSSTNPYGILGFAYLCESNTLYVSTVQGSNRQQEKGIIYAIDAQNGKITDKVENRDALGMGISYISGSRQLYFGSARTPDIYAVTLSNKGKFNEQPQHQFSIASLGPRGDDKVRRIKFDKSGQMQVIAIEFHFNLTAPAEKQESIYYFVWSDEEKKWLRQ